MLFIFVTADEVKKLRRGLYSEKMVAIAEVVGFVAKMVSHCRQLKLTAMNTNAERL
jgi:hypothetical protein